MADFKKVIPIILKHEGGLTDDPVDRGGITKYGISLNFARDTNDKKLMDIDHDGDIDRNDIKNLTKDQAIKIYKKHFWDKARLDEVYSDKVALNIMDAVVNHGIRGGIRMAQRTLQELGYDLEADGKIGPITLRALNSVYPDDFSDEFLGQRKSYYKSIVNKRPSQQRFMKGWMNRIESVRKNAVAML